MEDVYDEEEVVLRGLLLAPQVRLCVVVTAVVARLCQPNSTCKPLFHLSAVCCTVALVWWVQERPDETLESIWKWLQEVKHWASPPSTQASTVLTLHAQPHSCHKMWPGSSTSRTHHMRRPWTSVPSCTSSQHHGPHCCVVKANVRRSML